MTPRICPHCGKALSRTTPRAAPTAETIQRIQQAFSVSRQMTRQELVDCTGILGQSLRTNIVWLIEMGRVKETGCHVRGPSGRKHALLEWVS